MKPPWQRHPSCTAVRNGAVCGCPLTASDLESWDPKTRLRCAGCGEEYEGTDAEVERAKRADRALARHLAGEPPRRRKPPAKRATQLPLEVDGE